MFSHLRLASRCLRPCPRPVPGLCAHRSFSYTPPILTDLAPEPPSEAEVLEQVLLEQEAQAAEEAVLSGPSGSDEGREPETYNEFMEAIGYRFKRADAPKKWLGNQVPFPMNPSFKPPPPVSDAVKTTIYREFMHDPEKNNVRALSQRYHLSLKRVDAILRLKGMETDWVKGIPLQTGFRVGMENILGVPASRLPMTHVETRTDAHEADTLEQEERRDAVRQRYQRSYWESVPEDGREPIVPASLEFAKLDAKRHTRADEAYKSNPKLMPRVPDTDFIQTPRKKVQTVVKPGRPTIKFVDVGGHFIDVHDRVRRIAESERRAKIKLRKAEEKKAAILAGRRR
ncbi:hypothetical protein Hypma_016018 [Hypsizygus marmoreus]|uniref:37S ribosomal protein S35, mitochondrial n=1 Tax=Hypsizygus marmoreus TaxID=39966 RepID=A0A369K9T8_HYPMA|nr:hypothetical protein Hypma_016018 [Hypsizygus marmoreus]